MVVIEIAGDRAHFSVQGWDRLWSLTSQLDIPVAHILSARVDPEPALGWWHGLRVPGTQIPGVITAGSFYQHQEWVFYDVHDPEKTIVLELDHEHYKRLVIEVSDPVASVAQVEQAIARNKTMSSA